MDLIADMLLIAGALGAAVYCLIVARKVARLASLEGGMGNAIAILSAEVDDMTRALAAAQGAARGSTAQLADLSVRAEETARRLELLLAAMHDFEAGARGPASGHPADGPGPVPDGPVAAAAADGDAEPADGLFLTRRTRGGRVAS